MTRIEFEELQRKFASSGMTLKSFLKSSEIAYSTFNYWSRKTRAEAEPMPIAPITLHRDQNPTPTEPSIDAVEWKELHPEAVMTKVMELAK